LLLSPPLLSRLLLAGASSSSTGAETWLRRRFFELVLTVLVSVDGDILSVLLLRASGEVAATVVCGMIDARTLSATNDIVESKDLDDAEILCDAWRAAWRVPRDLRYIASVVCNEMCEEAMKLEAEKGGWRD
jgi:hypothetical protein